jgi:Putative Actinobacterial Holin-X, holin superfamily III
MDGETQMSTTNGRVREEEPNVATSFAGLAHDVIELGELQAQLFVHDVKSTTQKTRTSLLLGVIGACVLLGSVPVLLFALGEWIAERTGWPLSGGLAVAAAVGIAASAAILAAGWNRLSVGLNSMQRSRDELRRNIAWIKSSLRSQTASKPDLNRTSKADAPPNPR